MRTNPVKRNMDKFHKPSTHKQLKKESIEKELDKELKKWYNNSTIVIEEEIDDYGYSRR